MGKSVSVESLFKKAAKLFGGSVSGHEPGFRLLEGTVYVPNNVVKSKPVPHTPFPGGVITGVLNRRTLFLKPRVDEKEHVILRTYQ